MAKKNLDFFTIPEAQPIFDGGLQSAVNVVQAERNGKKNLDFFYHSRGAAYLRQRTQASVIVGF